MDAVEPATARLERGALTARFAFPGGVWFSISGGFMGDLAESLPSYWRAIRDNA
jgi:hypothetical protein